MLNNADAFLDSTVVDVRTKVVYFAVPRVANTAIKWAFAKVLRTNPENRHLTDWPHPTSDLAIHHRKNFEGLTFASISQTQRDEILHSPEWFIFTVVRPPSERLWSAWQYLVLLEDPHLSVMGRRVTSSVDFRDAQPEQVSEAFRTFLSSNDFRALYESDVHFRPQSELLADLNGHINIFHLDKVAELDRILENRYRDAGLCWERITPRNQSPFADDLFGWSDTEASVINSMYGKDKSQFGFPKLEARYRCGCISINDFRFRSAMAHEIRERNRRVLLFHEELSKLRRGEN